MVFSLVKYVWKSFVNRSAEITELQTEWSPLPELEKWPLYCNPKSSEFKLKSFIHYVIMAIVFMFSLTIMPVPIIFKLVILFGLVLITTSPILAQFFRPALPVLAWVILFFNSKNIPLSMRPPITVTVLPRLEDFFFADNLSELLATNTNTVKDIIAWLPYGIIHFSFPFIVAGLIFIFGPPTALNGFAFSFGYMNLTGVIIQNLVFSCAPPWYKVLHGLEKANYKMHGSPGGLQRIDKLLGVDLYTTGFTNSPLIFGAMPSLHSGCSTMDAIWLSYMWPKLTPLWAGYVMWLWYSTMYLTHHYFIDVVVGSNLALFWFLVWKYNGKLPINNMFCRWDFKTIELHDTKAEDLEFKQSLGISTYTNIDDFEMQNLPPSSTETQTGSTRNTTSNPRKPSNRESVDVVVT